MLYGTQRGGQMRHFRKDLKTATRLGAVLDPFKSIIYTSIRARARRFILEKGVFKRFRLNLFIPFKINPFWLTILRFVSARCRLPF